jgi:hypothetical protein
MSQGRLSCTAYSGKISRKFNVENIAVLFWGDCSNVYWLEYSQVKSLKTKGPQGGTPI